MSKFGTFKFGDGTDFAEPTSSFSNESSYTIVFTDEKHGGDGKFGMGYFGLGYFGESPSAFTDETSTTVTYTTE